VNRSPGAAETLADRVGARPAPLGELTTALTVADLCLASTGSPVAILDHDDLTTVAEQRAGRRLVIVDLGVPRNVAASDGAVDGVTLLDIDDLRRFVAANLDDRRREAARARVVLDDQLEEYVAESMAREVAPLLLALRHKAEAVRRSELDRLANRLAGLDDRQRDTVDALTKAILAKLLHDPTIRLKDASGTARGERLSESLRDLFEL
jgi:glutamyl-tRNA reductase